MIAELFGSRLMQSAGRSLADNLASAEHSTASSAFRPDAGDRSRSITHKPQTLHRSERSGQFRPDQQWRGEVLGATIHLDYLDGIAIARQHTLREIDSYLQRGRIVVERLVR